MHTNHNVGLTRASSEYNAKSIQIVFSRSAVHHFYGAACETESHRPQRALSGPVNNCIYCGDDIFWNISDLIALQKIVQFGQISLEERGFHYTARFLAHWRAGLNIRSALVLLREQRGA